MSIRLFTRKSRNGNGSGGGAAIADRRTDEFAESFEPAEAVVPPTGPLELLWHQERYAVITRDLAKWRQHPNGERVCCQACRRLEESMALVPAGRAALSQTLNESVGSPETELSIEPFLADIHCVTNGRYQHFVDAGGYDDLSLWPEEMWPHLIEMRDLTGHPGPRFWRNGRHDRRLANHPVVGVSWVEAAAFARWIGQRLPTEAEWQMAASWYIRSSVDIFRRFPWGDAMDHRRCNLWGSGRGGTAAVDAYPAGAAPNGVLQLVGNVWEWQASDFQIHDDGGQPVYAEMPMKAIRGAAFDTYFETQASSVFRTGAIALARAHNIGFRCALDLTDAPTAPPE